MKKFKFFVHVLTENQYERNTRKDIKTNHQTHPLLIKKDAADSNEIVKLS